MGFFTFDPLPFEIDEVGNLRSDFLSVPTSQNDPPSPSIDPLLDLTLPWISQPDPLWNPFLSPELPDPVSSHLFSSIPPDPPESPKFTWSPSTDFAPSPVTSGSDDHFSSADTLSAADRPRRVRKYRETTVSSVPVQFQVSFLAVPHGSTPPPPSTAPPISIEPCDWSLCQCENKTRKPARHFRTKCPYNPRLEKYHCTECGDPFTRKDNMLRHRWRVHKIR